MMLILVVYIYLHKLYVQYLENNTTTRVLFASTKTDETMYYSHSDMKSLFPKPLTSILHVSHFFPLKSMNRLDFIICWFSLYLIAEKSIKIFFHEIKFGEKSRTTLSYCPNTYFITIISKCNMVCKLFWNSALHITMVTLTSLHQISYEG